MKIEYYNGCTSSGLIVDGVEPDREKMLEVANLILLSLSNDSLKMTLQDLISSNCDEHEDFGQCDQCGDYPSSCKLEI